MHKIQFPCKTHRPKSNQTKKKRSFPSLGFMSILIEPLKFSSGMIIISAFLLYNLIIIFNGETCELSKIKLKENKGKCFKLKLLRMLKYLRTNAFASSLFLLVFKQSFCLLKGKAS